MNRRRFIQILACVPGVGAVAKLFAGKPEEGFWKSGAVPHRPPAEDDLMRAYRNAFAVQEPMFCAPIEKRSLDEMEATGRYSPEALKRLRSQV